MGTEYIGKDNLNLPKEACIAKKICRGAVTVSIPGKSCIGVFFGTSPEVKAPAWPNG